MIKVKAVFPFEREVDVTPRTGMEWEDFEGQVHDMTNQMG
jgi:hypothetical protein